MPNSNAVNLPTDVRPVEYRLTLEPDLTASTFKGAETVSIEVLEPTTRIVLNCIEVEVQACHGQQTDGDDRTRPAPRYRPES